MPKGLHEHTPRVAECGHEQKQPHALLADRHTHLAEVHLQLMPGRCLETQRRTRLSRNGLAQRRDSPLDRA
jgi:hypothetical protein